MELAPGGAATLGAQSIVEVASERVQRLEGFEATTAVVRGPDLNRYRFMERGFEFEIPLDVGQKTGFYFDQRENRALVEELSRGRRVLDAYSYVGAFSLAAARGGALSVQALDSSAKVIAIGATAAQHHSMEEKIQFHKADVKRALFDIRDRGERFGMAILDPPKLAPTTRHLDAGRKAYRKINAAALRLIEPDGILVTCSCSAAMRTHDFMRTLGLAARDAKREVSVLSMGQQGPDHPVPPSFPEGRYLKCAFLHVR